MSKGSISDGYHTFDELYEHRLVLFASLCNLNPEMAWKSKHHDDGSMFPDYFICGIETQYGQCTYHYHMDNWNLFKVKEIEFAPTWDGHTANDVVDRLKNVFCLTLPIDGINIEIEEGLFGLAGEHLGDKIYKEQIEPFLDIKVGGTIVFPDQVRRMSMSFIKACFGKIKDEMTIKDFKNKIKIVFLNSEFSTRLSLKIENEIL